MKKIILWIVEDKGTGKCVKNWKNVIYLFSTRRGAGRFMRDMMRPPPILYKGKTLTDVGQAGSYYIVRKAEIIQ